MLTVVLEVNLQYSLVFILRNMQQGCAFINGHTSVMLEISAPGHCAVALHCQRQGINTFITNLGSSLFLQNCCWPGHGSPVACGQRQKNWFWALLWALLTHSLSFWDKMAASQCSLIFWEIYQVILVSQNYHEVPKYVVQKQGGYICSIWSLKNHLIWGLGHSFWERFKKNRNILEFFPSGPRGILIPYSHRKISEKKVIFFVKTKNAVQDKS